MLQFDFSCSSKFYGWNVLDYVCLYDARVLFIIHIRRYSILFSQFRIYFFLFTLLVSVVVLVGVVKWRLSNESDLFMRELFLIFIFGYTINYSPFFLEKKYKNNSCNEKIVNVFFSLFSKPLGYCSIGQYYSLEPLP